MAPLPGSFTLRQDPSTQAFDGGTVLLGGSPLRLFRISERARDLLDRWKNGAAVGPRRSAQLLARRLSAGGAFNPEPTSSSLGAADVTVVVPVRDRPEQLDRLLDQWKARGWRASWSTTPRPMRGRPRRSPSATVRHSWGWRPTSDRPGPRNAGLAAVHGRRRRVRRLRLPPVGRVARSVAGPLRRPPVAAVAPRIVDAASRSSLDRGDRGRAGAPGEPHPVRARARPSWSGPTWRRDPTCSTLRFAVARTWTWSGACTRRAGRCATSRPARSPTRARPPGGLPGPPRLLRDDGRSVEPAARGGAWRRCTSRAGRCSSGPCCSPAGRCSR